VTLVEPVLIVGAGPAGLATAAEVSQRGIPYRLFERGPSIATSWVNAYDSLALHTGRHLSTLTGLKYPAGTGLFPTRAEFVDYLRAYVAHWRLAIETNSDVTTVRRDGADWVAVVNGTEQRGRALVMATGIMSKPVVPVFPGQDAFGGEILHSVRYRRPGPFTGKRVLVVGTGNSGGDIAAELGTAGVDVTILVRRGANVVPKTIAGVPIQYVAVAMRRLPTGVRRAVSRAVQGIGDRARGGPVLPRPPWTALDAIPMIGFHLVDAIKAGRVRVRVGAIAALEPGQVCFADGSRESFDAIVLATGFAPALDALGDLVRRDDRGFPMRTDDVTSADQPQLFFVGQRYDTSGALLNIRADSRRVADRLARGPA